MLKNKETFMALNGNLKDFRLEDIFQFLGLGQYIGCLRITRRNGIIGEIFFEKSTVVHARTGNTKGEQAIYAMFDWEEGEFIFDLNLVPPQTTIDQNWQGIILEAARLSDERSREGGIAQETGAPAGVSQTGDFDFPLFQEEEPVKPGEPSHDDLIETTFKEKSPSPPPDSGGAGEGEKIKTSGLFSALSEKKEKKKSEEESDVRSHALGKIGVSSEDSGILDKLRGFQINTGNRESEQEPKNDGEFMVFAVNTFLKEAQTTFNIAASDCISDMKGCLSQSGLSAVLTLREDGTLHLHGAVGREGIPAFCRLLELMMEQCRHVDSVKSIILFLKNYYQGLSGKERLMEKRFGYPLLSVKDVVDTFVDRLRQEDDSFISE